MTVADLLAALNELKPDLPVYVWPYDVRRVGEKPKAREPVELKIVTVYTEDEGVLLED
jgi:hypothetical protein